MKWNPCLPALALALCLTPTWAQLESKDPKDPGSPAQLPKPPDLVKPPEDGESKEPGDLQKPPAPATKIPTTSEGMAKLTGKWVADSASFAKNITASLQKAAGDNTTFRLDGIKGDYLATIDSEAKQIVVEWREWRLDGTATSKASGESKMTVSVTGRQVYRIKTLTEGEAPTARRIALKMEKDSANAKTTFRDIPIKSKVLLPKLGNGQWSVVEDKLYLLSDGEVFEFAREEEEAKK